MTKKDYILLARVINKWLPDDSRRALFSLELGKELKLDNPRFDLERWLLACSDTDKKLIRAVME